MVGRKPKQENNNRGHREGTFETLPSGLIACKIRFVDQRTGQDRTIKRSGKSGGEAKKNTLAAIKDIEDGNEHRKRDRLTVYEWLDRWLEEYQKPAIAPSTYILYEGCLRVHVEPRMNKILLTAVTTDDIQGMYADLLKVGKSKGKKSEKPEGLSPSSIRKIHNMMRKAFTQAVKQGMIPKNPVLDTKPVKVIRQEVRPLTEEQAKAVLHQAKDDRLYAGILLDFATGLRRGELVALSWNDIDLEQGTAKIWRQITRMEPKPKKKKPEENEQKDEKPEKVETKAEKSDETKNTEKKPSGRRMPIFEKLKTPKSRRTVPISKDVIAELKKHKARQAGEKLAAYNKAAEHEQKYGVEVDRSKYYQDTGLVFCMEDGTALDPDYIAKVFYRHLENAKLPHFRFHDIRHTFATLALSKGEPIKKVSAILGHANITLTLETYCHLMPELMEASVLEGVFTQTEAQPKAVGEVKSMGHFMGHKQKKTRNNKR